MLDVGFSCREGISRPGGFLVAQRYRHGRKVVHLMRACWNGVVLAESEDTVRLEGNHYFPLVSLRREFLRPSDTHTICPWKGEASYYDVVVDGEINRDAAWFYPNPSPAAAKIADRVAFWHGVKVERSDADAGGGWLDRARRLVGG